MTQNKPIDIALTPEEERVLDLSCDLMTAIRDLYGSESPYNFEEEVIPAIHVLQNFAKHHWGHRIAPNQWSDWTKDVPTEVI